MAPERATSLDDLHRVFSPTPLRTCEELKMWYCREVAEARGGGDPVARFSLALRDCYGILPFKGLLVGHQGVGKSTELARLRFAVEDRFAIVLHEATEELDPHRFEPFDVLLLTLESVLSLTARPADEGGAGFRPSNDLLKQVLDWLSDMESVREEINQINAEAVAGLKLSSPGLWAKFLGVFASLRGEMKYASSRKQSTVEYRMSRISTLVDTANRIFDECTDAMREANGKEFLIIWEGFDKREFSWEQILQLFVIRGRMLRDLRVHLILTLPVALAYSPDAAQLPFPRDFLLSIPDTAVFALRKGDGSSDRVEYVPNNRGRNAIKAVIESRADASLFAAKQMRRLIIASGGNLQYLFSMICYAGNTARLREAPKIGKHDVDTTIAKYRADYLKLLGASRDDPQIEYEAKAKRLVEIYEQVPAKAGVPDPVLLALLRAKAAQEFNGKGWFGVHPFVVDILADQGRLKRGEDGRIQGGTE